MHAITFAFVRVGRGRSAPRRVVEKRQTLVAIRSRRVVLASANPSGRAVDGRTVHTLAGVPVTFASVANAKKRLGLSAERTSGYDIFKAIFMTRRPISIGRRQSVAYNVAI